MWLDTSVCGLLLVSQPISSDSAYFGTECEGCLMGARERCYLFYSSQMYWMSAVCIAQGMWPMRWGVYTLNLGSWITPWRKMNFIWAEIIFRTGSLSQSSVALLLLSTGYLYKRLKMNCERGNSVQSCVTRSRQVCFCIFMNFLFFSSSVCLTCFFFLIYFVAVHSNGCCSCSPLCGTALEFPSCEHHWSLSWVNQNEIFMWIQLHA